MFFWVALAADGCFGVGSVYFCVFSWFLLFPVEFCEFDVVSSVFLVVSDDLFCSPGSERGVSKAG